MTNLWKNLLIISFYFIQMCMAVTPQLLAPCVFIQALKTF